MFGKKKTRAKIDKEQLELIQNAQHRIRQKKRFYSHSIVFLILSLLLYTFNVGLGFKDEITVLSMHWSVIVILIWFVLLCWHFLNVFVFQVFMGKAWEQKQLDKLVALQQDRIQNLKKELEKEAPIIADSEHYNKRLDKQNTVITIIAAAGENNAIGKDNSLIWHLRDDLIRFKKLTSGHHIIMGRKTFESFPKPLPNRTHVVVTRQTDYNVPDGVVIVDSLEKAIELSQKNDRQPFIIGGGEIYQQAMTLANRIELTRVHETFDADTFFPEIDPDIWQEINNTFHSKDKDHDYEFSFLTYIRKH